MNNNIDLSAKECTLLELADNLAAAATSFGSHGYDVFIRARDEFKATLYEMLISVSVERRATPR